jgi:uncharacterized protein (DUF1800 family)
MRQFPLAAVVISALGVAAIAAPPAAEDRAVAHVLNRVAYGPRTGDLEQVRAMGVRRYVDAQLNPAAIPDAAMERRLAGLSTLRMSLADIVRDIERPQIEARRARKQQGDAAPILPEAIRQRANSVVVELSEQKLLRAVYSERQLQELLTDFWFNHFNVDARKGRDRFLVGEYERDAIRPHVLGSFRALLGASAKSPAMLFYLDNWMNVDPNAPRLQVRPGNNQRRGLNENYARELMELHTLGVDGGFTQKDVTEVARAFTGWTIENPQRGAGFRFEPRLHDSGEKTVLGHVIKSGGGESDGEQVLDILAAHPSTARFVVTKLARRFIGDTPSSALIDRAAAKFRDSRGDLREVTRTILTSPEFLSPATYEAKVKTPLEFVASALRASGADVSDAKPLVRELQQLGMPLYMCQPPTGYPDTADAWVNSGALVARLNFAVRLTGGSLRGIAVPPDARSLPLGSPEFQKR